MSICLSRADRTVAYKKHPSPLQSGKRRKSKMPGRKSHTSQQPRGSLTVPRGCFSISFPASGLSSGFWANKKHPKSSDFRCFLSMPPTGVEPVLCLQKGILSPSCLPISPQRHTDTRLIKSCYPALLQGAGNNRRKVQMPHLSSMMGTSLNFKSMMLMIQQSALFVKKRLCRNRQNCHQYLLLMASTMRSVCSRPFVSCIRLEIIALI